jgi:SAM-dependent methyltransferase
VTDRDWAAMLAEWAIPDELVAAAPASPYFFDPTIFTGAADDAVARDHDTVSDRAGREALPPSGSVLDVGVGGGAASLRLGARHITGVDSNEELLDAFASRCAAIGIDATPVHGSWPEVASSTAHADVVVCHHVVYNVPAITGFVGALADHARRRVVLELTAEHPMAWLRPYWQALHGLEQPRRPHADDLVDVLKGLGFPVQTRQWSRPYQMIGESSDQRVERIGRRLCLPTERYDELRRLLVAQPPPVEREVVTIWWDVSPRG